MAYPEGKKSDLTFCILVASAKENGQNRLFGFGKQDNLGFRENPSSHPLPLICKH